MKRVRSKKWLLGLVLLPAISFAQIDSAKVNHYEFSIQQAVDYAKKNNVNVKNALLDVEYQHQVNREVTSRAYPSINGSLGTTYNPNIATQVIPNFIGPATYDVLIEQGVKDGNGNPIIKPDNFGFLPLQFGTKFTANAGISLSQILFDGQVFVGLMARKTTMDFANKKVEVTEETIKVNIYKIYYQLVVAKTQIELLDSNIAFLEKNLKDTRIIYENGFREKLDVDKASVSLTNLQTEKTKALNAISNGYYALKMLIGMPAKDELVLTDKISDSEIKEGILEASEYNYEDRKLFQYTQIAKQLNEYNVRRYKLSQIPTVALNAQYAKSAQRDKWNFFGKGDWFTISNINLNVSIPIFNGFYTKTKIEQAKIDVRRTDVQLEDLKLTIDAQVAMAKNNYRTAIVTIDNQKRNMQLAENIYQQTKKKYEMGLGTQLEINAAQTEMKTAQTNYISALYDAIIARIDFLNATGKL